MEKRNRIVMLLVAILFIVSVLFTAVFIVHNAEHDCNGSENCTVCVQISRCEETLRSIALVATSCGSGIVYIYIVSRCPSIFRVIVAENSLVTLKIKLSC